MTINGLSDALSKYNIKTSVPISDFTGTSISIDMPHLLYQMKAVSTKDILYKTDLTIRDPDVSVIEKMTRELIIGRLLNMRYNGINPVCVFDGKPHPLRQLVREKRNIIAQKDKALLLEVKEKLKLADPLERNIHIQEYRKYYSRIVDMPKSFIDSCIETCVSLGFKVFMAHEILTNSGDAEGACAALCQMGLTAGAYCIDCDFHVYGGTTAILEMSDNSFTTRTLQNILDKSGLDFNQFRCSCILAGTDYNENIRGIAFTTASGIIKKCNLDLDLKQELKHHKKTQDADLTVINFDEVYSIFSCSWNSVLDVSFDDSKWNSNYCNVLSGYSPHIIDSWNRKYNLTIGPGAKPYSAETMDLMSKYYIENNVEL
jgi:5'-3' exonuclease